MADEKVTDMVEETAPASTDLVEVVVDPAGSPDNKKLELGTLLGNDGAWVNLIKNSPGQIAVDGAEPQWWDDVADAVITDEDTAGEGIPDRTERCFKVVTAANDVYGYQTLTFADESLLDAGVTNVSLSCWVYCGTGSKASIGIYGTNLGLEESSQAGASAWTLLTVENITLDAADTSIQVRLIVDTDTAYFTMPMLNTGSKPLPWKPRGWRFVAREEVAQLTLENTGDVAATTTDCTANTDPLCVAVQGYTKAIEPNGTVGSNILVGHSADVVGSFKGVVRSICNVVNTNWFSSGGPILCNDGQEIGYSVYEADADSDLNVYFYITGYWVWE